LNFRKHPLLILPIMDPLCSIKGGMKAQSPILLFIGIFSALAFAAAVALGQTYIDRLPNHEGYFLVDGSEGRAEVVSKVSRPQRTFIVVVDGLSYGSAREMSVVDTLRKHGQCHRSDQGSYTLSRPVYALLSTGLEVDRSGARSNDLTTPLRVESIWQTARARACVLLVAATCPGFNSYSHQASMPL
jgi:hypothetical protein